MVEHRTTFCRICEPLCGMVATVDDGRLIALRPDRDHPLSEGFACPKGIAFTEVHNDPDRVTTPLRRNSDGGFDPVSWEEAMSDIADRLAAILDRGCPRAVGWYLGNPGAFSYSHTMWAGMFVAGLGRGAHLFSASSQDVSNRLLASLVPLRCADVVAGTRRSAHGPAGRDRSRPGGVARQRAHPATHQGPHARHRACRGGPGRRHRSPAH